MSTRKNVHGKNDHVSRNNGHVKMSTVNTETKVFKQHKSSEDTEHCTELRLLSTPEEPHRYDSSYELCDKADVSIVTATAI